MRGKVKIPITEEECHMIPTPSYPLYELNPHHHHNIVQLNHQADCHHVCDWWHYRRFPAETAHGPLLDRGRRSFLLFELIGSRPSVITAAASTVFSLPVTARRRVQSGPEWCPDGLEALTARQTSPAAPRLCTLGELWSHPGGIRVLPEALQHRGPGWCLLHVQTAETAGVGSRGARELGEGESDWWLWAIRFFAIDRFISLIHSWFFFWKIQLFEFLSGSTEVSERPDSSVPSTPSSKSRSCSSQVIKKGATCIIKQHKKPFFPICPQPSFKCLF